MHWDMLLQKIWNIRARFGSFPDLELCLDCLAQGLRETLLSTLITKKTKNKNKSKTNKQTHPRHVYQHTPTCVTFYLCVMQFCTTLLVLFCKWLLCVLTMFFLYDTHTYTCVTFLCLFTWVPLSHTGTCMGVFGPTPCAVTFFPYFIRRKGKSFMLK